VQRAALGALLAAGASACAASGADIHLAPLYSRTHTADAGVETDVLGGLWRHRRNVSDGRLEDLTFGPIYSHSPTEEGHLTHFLVPLGYGSERGDEARATLYPIYIWGRTPEQDGSSTWQLASLPGVLIEGNERTGVQFGIFPLWGAFEDFVTFDQLVFVLWPIFVYAERNERVSYHFLWPFIGWTTGGGESSFRFFPFYSRTKYEGRFDRRFFLWPFFHYQRNHLGGGGEEPETVWMVWPLYGETERGTYKAWTWLWPFFGYSRDPRNGYWALDLPWPLVRFERGPEVHRSRVWPFFSYTLADGLETRAFLWPLIQFRHEHSRKMIRDSTWVIPLWQSLDRLDLETGEETTWRKLFPLFQHERRDEWRKGSFPTLDPFWRNQLIDRHYAWMWKLWEWETEGRMRRDRSWLGLYKRERGLGEDRKSLAGLWSSRHYHVGGRAVTETSLLFGLLRWRVTRDDGFDILRPAFPGPGWPMPGAVGPEGED
jgi:hypothetical protein